MKKTKPSEKKKDENQGMKYDTITEDIINVNGVDDVEFKMLKLGLEKCVDRKGLSWHRNI